MASREKTTKFATQAEDVTAAMIDDAFAETEREAGYKDGVHAAAVTVDEVLQAVRVDTENAALDPIAETAAKLTIEAISRLWYERKGAL